MTNRNTITFTISIPPEMAMRLEATMKKEHRTRSELVREALRLYMHQFYNHGSYDQTQMDSRTVSDS